MSKNKNCIKKQCTCISKSTGKRCKLCITKENINACWRHAEKCTRTPKKAVRFASNVIKDDKDTRTKFMKKAREMDERKIQKSIKSRPGYEIRSRPGYEIKSRPGYEIKSRPGYELQDIYNTKTGKVETVQVPLLS